mmetsp:Transcript_82530/g.260579  ORF Transcript_82530/g.260579 Transcript_82530/m.260579 type:complete len:259 (+) Transcript_82530:559-1335(+)
MEHEVRHADEHAELLPPCRAGALHVDVAPQPPALRLRTPHVRERSQRALLGDGVPPEANELLDGAHGAGAQVRPLRILLRRGAQQQDVPRAVSERREGRPQDGGYRPGLIQHRIVLEDHPGALAPRCSELVPQVRVGQRAAQHLGGAPVGGLGVGPPAPGPLQKDALLREDPSVQDQLVAERPHRAGAEASRVPGPEPPHGRARAERGALAPEGLLQPPHVAVPRALQGDDPELQPAREVRRQVRGRQRARHGACRAG